MTYPNLFRTRYPSLQGRDWLRTIDPEDRAVFVDIGSQAHDHGRLGGQALVAKRGKEYMAAIGRRGAILTNIRKSWIKSVKEETEKELGIHLEY